MKQQKRKIKWAEHPNVSLFLFSFPFLILFLIFFLIPFVYGIAMSFTNSTGFTPGYDWVGFKNYIELFTSDSRFYSSMLITILFTVLSVSIGNVLALILSFAIESGIKGKNTFRTLYFLPYVFALVIIGFVWQFIYVQFIPQLGEWLHLSFLNQDYLGNPKIAIFSVIVMQIWYTTGYYLIIYIAGIQAIDTSLLESANIDGASSGTIYRKIMIPLLIPSISICVFSGIASSFKAFDAILSLTGGGPGFATEVLSLNIYYEAMGDAQRYGYGMAKAIIMAIIIFVITLVQLRYFKSKEVEV